MEIILIAAKSKNNVIGKDGKIPWYLPNELKFFRSMTVGNAVLMGRKTFESIGKKLRDRDVIIVTRDKEYTSKECHVVHSINEGIEKAKELNASRLYIAGGEEIYRQTIYRADKMYLTIVDYEIQDGDSFFPHFSQYEWEEEKLTNFPKDNKHLYPFEIYKYKKLDNEY